MTTGDIVADILLRIAYVLLTLSVSSAVFFVLRTLTKSIVETLIVFAVLALFVVLGMLLGNGVLFVIGGALTYIWLIISSFMQKNTAAYTSLAGVFVLLITFLICYSVAGDEVLESYMKFDITPAVSKFIGGMINTTLVLLFMAVLSGFVASVYTALKR